RIALRCDAGGCSSNAAYFARTNLQRSKLKTRQREESFSRFCTVTGALGRFLFSPVDQIRNSAPKGEWPRIVRPCIRQWTMGVPAVCCSGGSETRLYCPLTQRSKHVYRSTAGGQSRQRAAFHRPDHLRRPAAQRAQCDAAR